MVTRKRNPARRRRTRARGSILFGNPLKIRRRRRRRTRRNSWFDDARGHAKAARLGWSRRKRRGGKRRKNPARSYRRTYRRRRRNPVYRVPARTNRRRRRYARRRRNPNGALRRMMSRQWLMQSATIGGGVALGALGMAALQTYGPAFVRDNRRYMGLFHVALGALLVTMVRNRMARTFGVVIAGTGMYDLVASNISALGLPPLPDTSALLAQFAPASAPVSASYQVARRPVSGPAIGSVAASYLPRYGMAASYEAPASRTVGLRGDYNPYAEVGCFQ